MDAARNTLGWPGDLHPDHSVFGNICIWLVTPHIVILFSSVDPASSRHVRGASAAPCQLHSGDRSACQSARTSGSSAQAPFCGQPTATAGFHIPSIGAPRFRSGRAHINSRGVFSAGSDIDSCQRATISLLPLWRRPWSRCGRVNLANPATAYERPADVACRRNKKRTEFR